MDIGICIDILRPHPLTLSLGLCVYGVFLSFSSTAVCGIVILILSCNLLITIITHDIATVITHTTTNTLAERHTNTNIWTLLLRCNCLRPVDRSHLTLISFCLRSHTHGVTSMCNSSLWVTLCVCVCVVSMLQCMIFSLVYLREAGESGWHIKVKGPQRQAFNLTAATINALSSTNAVNTEWWYQCH